MLRVVNILLASVLLAPLLFGGFVHAEESGAIVPLFNEVKVRFDSSNPLDVDEYIEIVNPFTEAIDLNRYVIEYFNTTNPSASQQPTQKPIADGLLGPGSSVVLAKNLDQIEDALQSPFSSLTDTGGRLRLVTIEGDVVDEIAWSNSSSLATTPGVTPAVVYQCNSSTALCTANRIQSIGRQLDSEGSYVLVEPIWVLGTTSPLSSILLPVPSEDDAEDPGDGDSGSENDVGTCEEVIITEVFPNPDGSDTGKEYIELYNPSDSDAYLKTCSLQVSSSSKTYNFGDVLLAPGGFLAVSDTESGLTLPNAAGGTVWLLTTSEEIQSITYPGEVDDDASWSLINSQWQQSYMPTPGLPNIALPTKPCPVGQQRNTATNRCENIITTAVAALTPCKPGQTRNPETNRCRTIVTATSLLVPCKEGQERNPETNRCRTISSGSALTACPEGQERNPDTNRCRKVVPSDGQTLAAVTDVASPTVNDASKWWLAGAVVLLAVGYGLYEWRQDIGQLTRSFTARITRSK